jgi:transcriptional regulator
MNFAHATYSAARRLEPAFGTGAHVTRIAAVRGTFSGGRTSFPLVIYKRSPGGGHDGDDVSDQTDLIQGTLDLLILRTIALEPMHGWAIAQRIQQISDELLRVQQGSLYPALHRLEHQGWITAEWGQSEANRKARFYSLTKAGRKQVELEVSKWERLSAGVNLVLART